MRKIFFNLLFLTVQYTVVYGQLVDQDATRETKSLYSALLSLQSAKKTILGHQDAVLYGRHWEGDSDRSDAKDLTGSHPGMIGMDLEKITESSVDYRRQKVDELVRAIKETYKRGGVVTLSWHMSNPANHGSFYWEKNPIVVVKDILPGGKHHDRYNYYLKTMAQIMEMCQGKRGELIPVLFRPFHEMDGNWFWWGADQCTAEEYTQLWQYTVRYLRDELHVHNLIYVFSPDCRFKSKEEYLIRYPGDAYVDVLGMDDYWDFRPDGANDPKLAEAKLGIVYNLSLEKNKVAGLTEFGLEGIPDSSWFTKIVLPILQRYPVSFAMLWRNAHDDIKHFYLPTVGHPAAADFIEFAGYPNILMQHDLPDLYNRK